MSNKALKCYFSNEYIKAYIDNKLNFKMRKMVEKHLQSCPYCKYEYENFLQEQKINKKLDKICGFMFVDYFITTLVGCCFLSAVVYFFAKLLFFYKL